MSTDSTFDHIKTPEEIAAEEQDAELARRIRAEVLRVQSGEAAEDIAEDERIHEEAQERARVEAERREKQNFWQILASGRILLHDGVARYYSHLALIFALTFISIVVMFWSLRIDMQHIELSNEVQLLRERSIRLRESSYMQTSHSAIRGELERRDIDLKDSRTPSIIIDN